MILLRTARIVIAACAALSLSACHRQCGIVSSTVGKATVRGPSGVAVASVSFLLREEVGPTKYYIAGGLETLGDVPRTGLWGHVTRARLVTASGETLVEMETASATFGGFVIAHTSNPLSYSEFVRLRDALLTTRTRLLVDTNLVGLEHLDTPINDARLVPGAPTACPSD